MTYNFTANANQLIASLDTEGGKYDNSTYTYLQPTFEVSSTKLYVKDFGVIQNDYTFPNIGTIGGDTPSDLQDAKDLLIALVANFNSGGGSPQTLQNIITAGSTFNQTTNDETIHIDLGTYDDGYLDSERIVKTLPDDGAEIVREIHVYKQFNFSGEVGLFEYFSNKWSTQFNKQGGVFYPTDTEILLYLFDKANLETADEGRYIIYAPTPNEVLNGDVKVRFPNKSVLGDYILATEDLFTSALIDAIFKSLKVGSGLYSRFLTVYPDDGQIILGDVAHDVNGTGFDINDAAKTIDVYIEDRTNLKVKGIQIATLDDVLNVPHVIFTPTVGGTVNLVNKQNNIINPAGTLLTLTVNLPSSPSDNDFVQIKFTRGVSTLSYTGGTVVNPITTPVLGTMIVLTYDLATTSWY